MKKINKLTRAQEVKVPIYLKKWLDNGRKTTRINQTKTRQAIIDIYECAGMKPPKYFFFFPSPIQCQLAVSIMRQTNFKKLFEGGDNLSNNLGKNLRNNLWNNLEDNLGSNLGSNLWNNLRNNLSNNLGKNLSNNLSNNLGKNLSNNLSNNLGKNLRNNLEDNIGNNLEDNIGKNLWNNLWKNLSNNLGKNLRNNLWNNLRNNLEDNLWSNLEDNLGSNLGSNLRNNLEDNIGNNLENNLGKNLWNNLGKNLRNNLEDNIGIKYEPPFFGNHWTWWVGFYDFVLNELFESKISEYGDFIKYLTALQNVHVFIPFKDLVFISDNPESMTLDSSGRLHGETAPAMAYSDGYSLFYLNGVQVPKWAIETPKDDITSKQILELKNTEQRMALMRFVGLQKFMKQLNAKQIHEYNGYKLYYLTVEDQQIGPYLGMVCPSSGREFLEGVGDPDGDNFIDARIKTCQDALKWRAMKASKNLMTKFNLKWTYHA